MGSFFVGEVAFTRERVYSGAEGAAVAVDGGFGGGLGPLRMSSVPAKCGGAGNIAGGTS